jgi:hypothetical protein
MDNTNINIKETNLNVQTEINEWILNLYKDTVDLCKKYGLKDYKTKLPLICYVNRDQFIKLIDDHIQEMLEDSTKNYDQDVSNNISDISCST